MSEASSPLNAAAVAKELAEQFGSKLGIVSEDLLVRPTFRQQFHDELDGNSRPFNDGLAHEHLWVDGDSFFPVHT